MDFGWLWIAVIILSVVLEAMTDQLISIWFVPGAVIGTILDFLNVGEVYQVLVFLLLSIVGILFIRKYLTRFVPDKTSKTNIDAIVGEKCVVTEKIDNFAGCGQAKVKGQIWSARGLAEDDVFEVGEVLRIVAIEGVKIICKKND